MATKTRGFRELERALAEDLPKATARNVLRRVGLRAMQPVADRMAQLAPKDRGDLSESMKVEVVKAKRASRTRYSRSTGIEIAAGPAPEGVLNRSNAAWQENGTVDMPAQPYARPAADQEGPKVIETVGDDLAAEIDKAVARVKRKAAKG